MSENRTPISGTAGPGIFEVPIKGNIYIEAKHAEAALKIARNWSHQVVSDAEGAEPYTCDLSAVRLLHIKTDQDHVFFVTRFFAEAAAKADAYRRKRIAPYLPKKVREQMEKRWAERQHDGSTQDTPEPI